MGIVCRPLARPGRARVARSATCSVGNLFRAELNQALRLCSLMHASPAKRDPNIAPQPSCQQQRPVPVMDADTQHEELPDDTESRLDAISTDEIDGTAPSQYSGREAGIPPPQKRNACISPQSPPSPSTDG